MGLTPKQYFGANHNLGSWAMSGPERQSGTRPVVRQEPSTWRAVKIWQQAVGAKALAIRQRKKITESREIPTGRSGFRQKTGKREMGKVDPCPGGIHVVARQPRQVPYVRVMFLH